MGETKNSLLPFGFIARCQFIKQLRVHFHESLQNVVNERDDRLIPVFFANAIKRWKHDRHDDSIVVFNQRHRVFVIPEVKCTFGNLNERFFLAF
jgi:hypothetical protein